MVLCHTDSFIYRMYSMGEYSLLFKYSLPLTDNPWEHAISTSLGKKSCILETQTLSACSDSSTNIINPAFLTLSVFCFVFLLFFVFHVSQVTYQTIPLKPYLPPLFYEEKNWNSDRLSVINNYNAQCRTLWREQHFSTIPLQNNATDSVSKLKFQIFCVHC